LHCGIRSKVGLLFVTVDKSPSFKVTGAGKQEQQPQSPYEITLGDALKTLS